MSIIIFEVLVICIVFFKLLGDCIITDIIELFRSEGSNKDGYARHHTHENGTFSRGTALL